MADDDHSRHPRRRRRQCDSRGGGGRGGSCSDTAIGGPHGNDGYTSGPLYLDHWTDTIQMWPGSGGRRLAASPISDASRCSPVRSSSAAGRPDLCVTPDASTSGSVETVDDPQRSLLQSSSATSPPPPASWQPWMSSWNQQPLAHSFHTTMMVPPATYDWVVDFATSNHTTSSASNLTSVRPLLPTDPSSIVVGNRSSLPVTSIGNMTFLDSFYLHNVLVTPDIIQNLLFVCCFTTDNWRSMEFDPYDLSVNDLSSQNVIARCNSS
jgi:hypothetical protein